jgi:hypothetical protein
VTIVLTVRNTQELQENVTQLGRRVADGAFQRVFDLLDQM